MTWRKGFSESGAKLASTARSSTSCIIAARAVGLSFVVIVLRMVRLDLSAARGWGRPKLPPSPWTLTTSPPIAVSGGQESSTASLSLHHSSAEILQ